MTYILSGANVRNLLNLFDIRVLFALMRENLGTLLSVSNPLHNHNYCEYCFSCLLIIIAQSTAALVCMTDVPGTYWGLSSA